jgi:hypothetical protein
VVLRWEGGGNNVNRKREQHELVTAQLQEEDARTIAAWQSASRAVIYFVLHHTWGKNIHYKGNITSQNQFLHHLANSRV